MGNVSASEAATMSVEITEAVARGMDYSLPEGIFCSQFVLGVEALFKSTYPKLGVTVKR